MVTPVEIKPYDITGGEIVQYGYYAALEVVFNQFLNELETYFFDEFNTSLEFNYNISTGMKFKKYLERIQNPQPIFLFNLYPLVGECLLVMENRSVNLLLARDSLNQYRKLSVNNQFLLNADNSKQIQTIIDHLLSLFSDCWSNILPVKSHLKKLVSNKIKARVMSPVEACVIVKINIKQNHFSTYWEFCFSDYHLDQVIKKHGSKLLLHGNGEAMENQLTRKHYTELLLEESHYRLTAVLGELHISENDLLDSYHNQTVIPIRNDISNNVIVAVNETPLLSASAGTTNDCLALQINGKYESKKVEEKAKHKSFAKLEFPDGSK
ncbi:MAG: FliM/FliN family flagellar motor switch protein [bacterium]